MPFAPATTTARLRAPDGSIITVHRMIGEHVTDNDDAYIVSVGLPGERERDRIAAGDLAEAIARMRELDIPGFLPNSDAWQPSTA